MKSHARDAGCVRLPLAAAAVAMLLAGCAVTPVPLTDGEVRSRTNSDQFKIYSEQEPVFKPIGLNEAVARSLKYNLDYRLKLMEAALSAGLAEVAHYDMLPNLVASAGYTTRNNDSGGTSVRIDTGAVSLVPSTSQERARRLNGADFSWNILDFGLGYYRARQKANEVLIAEERRRRVVQNILQDVRSAYWRAVGAQRLARDGEKLMERVRSALERSRAAETQGLLSPKDALTYQRLLLDAVQLLTTRRQELEFAKRELAALMNITPGTEFTVVEADEPELMPAPMNVAELEELALLNRPELREEDYRHRINADEARRQLLALMPGLGLTVSSQHDSNRYLHNANWVESSARVTFNLFRALSYPALSDSHDAQRKSDEARRLSLSMAILTQVRVAVERYRLTLADLEIAKESSQVDQRMAAYARAALTAQADSELELIRAETRALNSEFQRYAAYANAQGAFGRIYNSLGLEVVPPDIADGTALTAIGEAVIENIRTIERETFIGAMQRSFVAPPIHVHLDVSGQLPPAARDEMRKAIEQALRRNHIRLAAAGDRAPTLTLRLDVDAPRNSTRRGAWRIALRTQDNAEIGNAGYASFLAAEPTSRSLIAFSEAATISNLRNLNDWLAVAAEKK